MGHAIWKLTCLVGISGLGFLILLQVQQGLQESNSEAETESVATEAEHAAPNADESSPTETNIADAHGHEHHEDAPQKAITWHSNPFEDSENAAASDEMQPVTQRDPAEDEQDTDPASVVEAESPPAEPVPAEDASDLPVTPASFAHDEAAEPAPFRRKPDAMLIADASEASSPPHEHQLEHDHGNGHEHDHGAESANSAEKPPAFLGGNEAPAPSNPDEFGPNPFAAMGASPEPVDASSESGESAQPKPELIPGPTPAPAGADLGSAESDKPEAIDVESPQETPAAPSPFGTAPTTPEIAPGDAVPFDPSTEEPKPESTPPLQPEPMPTEEPEATAEPVESSPEPTEELPSAAPVADPAASDPFGTSPTESAKPASPEPQPESETPPADPFGALKADPFGEMPADTTATPPSADPPAEESLGSDKTDETAPPVMPADDPFKIKDDPFGTQPKPQEEVAPETESANPADDLEAPAVEPEVGEMPAADPPEATSPFGAAPPFEARPEPLTGDNEAEADPIGIPAEPGLATGDMESPEPFPSGDSHPANNSPADDANQDLETAEPADDSISIESIGTVTADDPRGPQQARITVEKVAPPQATLGEPLIYEIVVTNVGESPAHEVTVSDAVPQGTTLKGTIPQAIMKDDRLTWKLGTLKPEESSKIRIRVIPTEAGSIGSVATVNFVSEVAAQTEIVVPKLALRLTAPGKVSLGESVDFKFEIANEGTAPAENVMLRDLLPEGFRHADGNDLEYEIGTLPPGAVKTVTLRVATVKAGEYSNHAVLTGKGGLKAEATASVTITGQQVSLIRKGPKQQFVGRPAIYTNIVRNTSDKPVTGATVIETIPAGMEFVKASEGGQYNPQERTVAWQVGPLAPGAETEVNLTLTAAIEGAQQSVVRVEEVNGDRVQVSSMTQIETMAGVTSAIQSLDGPVIVGERAAFRILLQNASEAPANDVRVSLSLPEQVKFIEAVGADAIPGAPGVTTIKSTAPIPPGGEQTIEFIVEGIAAGDAHLKASIQSAQLADPLIREAELRIVAARS